MSMPGKRFTVEVLKNYKLQQSSLLIKLIEMTAFGCFVSGSVYYSVFLLIDMGYAQVT